MTAHPRMTVARKLSSAGARRRLLTGAGADIMKAGKIGRAILRSYLAAPRKKRIPRRTEFRDGDVSRERADIRERSGVVPKSLLHLHRHRHPSPPAGASWR